MCQKVTFTDSILSPAYGKETTAEPYANLLAIGTVEQSEQELLRVLKSLERELGDSNDLRNEDVVMMDLDLLQYDKRRLHHDDWHRPYIQSLLKCLTIILFFLTVHIAGARARVQSDGGPSDKELLGMGVEYYSGGKYHEAILTFEKLRKTYRLSPRLSAYLGFSYYKEGNYEDAAGLLKPAINDLGDYSPREQSAYIFACAESLFATGEYAEALDYYEMALPLTEGNDKGDVLFHTAFAMLYKEKQSDAEFFADAMTSEMSLEGVSTATIEQVQRLLSDAVECYKADAQRATALQRSRRRQSVNMLKAMAKALEPAEEESK